VKGVHSRLISDFAGAVIENVQPGREYFQRLTGANANKVTLHDLDCVRESHPIPRSARQNSYPISAVKVACHDRLTDEPSTSSDAD